MFYFALMMFTQLAK